MGGPQYEYEYICVNIYGQQNDCLFSWLSVEISIIVGLFPVCRNSDTCILLPILLPLVTKKGKETESINSTDNERGRNTLDEGSKIDPKILDDDEAEDSVEPKRSVVKEEDEEDEPICFFPSIFLNSLCIQNLSRVSVFVSRNESN